MLKQIKEKPLSQLIVELQQKYQEENDQSNLFQKLYQQQGEIESSTESSIIVPALFSGSTGSSSSHSQEGVEKKIKKQRKGKGNQDDKKSTIETNDKKTLQMIRNRISAQNSRDRKKAYLQKLEGDFNQQSNYIQELTDQVNYLQQQLQDVQKLNQHLQSQQSNLICVNCGNKQFVIEEEIPISVSKNKALNKFGFSFIVILTIIACLSINFETSSQNLNVSSLIQEDRPEIQNLNNTDSQFQILQQLRNSRIKGMTDLMEFNSEQNFKFHDTTYRAVLNTKESFVNKMINYNKEKAKQNNNGQALAPLNYHKPQVDSLYCPTVYKYDNQTQGKIQVKYQDEQWIHLVIPKNNVNIFYQNQDKSIIVKEKFSDQDGDIREKYQEIWCQVKSINDFYI